jgi:hypothetical protein
VVSDQDDPRIRREEPVERWQTKLQTNTDAIERWQRKLFRAANELQKLIAQRKRLLNPGKGKLKYKGEILLGSGGGAGPYDNDMNDEMPL